MVNEVFSLRSVYPSVEKFQSNLNKMESDQTELDVAIQTLNRQSSDAQKATKALFHIASILDIIELKY